MIKKSLVLIMIMFLALSNVLGVSYVFNSSDKVEEQNIKMKTAQSSVATIAAPEFNMQSKAQVVMDATTGKVIYANNENERLLPASVTKVMTMLLIMEAINDGKMSYTDTVECSETASKMGGSQIWFKPGEKLTIDEALKAIAVVSGNDVSVAMAEKIGGSEVVFVQMMNEKAKALGMTNTNFMNCHGIDEENHYTSAGDIAIMSRELIKKHPEILKYTSIWMDSIRGGAFGLSSTNRLIKTYNGTVGLKTGSTSKALFNVSAVAKRDEMTIIAVVMTAPTSDIRNEEAKQLLDYAFVNFKVDNKLKRGDVLGEIEVAKNVSEKVEYGVNENVSILLNKSDKSEYTQKITMQENIKAPLKKGDTVGKIEYISQDKNVAITKDLVTTKDINVSSMIEYIKYGFKKYIML